MKYSMYLYSVIRKDVCALVDSLHKLGDIVDDLRGRFDQTHAEPRGRCAQGFAACQCNVNCGCH